MADAIIGRYLSISDVMAETSLSRTTIYRMIRKGEFPASVQLSAQRVAWDSTALQAWKMQRASGLPN
ncbi:MAG: AlpA family phage regulatory protein [Novosphingobium sp.]